jgi:hypothetical protein
MTQKLTDAQVLILAKVRAMGSLTLNSRARKPLETLEKLGLVTVTWEVQPDALRGRHTLIAHVKPNKETK